MKENVNDNVNIFSYFQVELHIYLNNYVFGVKGQLEKFFIISLVIIQELQKIMDIWKVLIWYQ